MNERYLFRGKRIDNGEWVTGRYCNQIKCINGAIHVVDVIQIVTKNDCGATVTHHFEVDLDTVGQCTGLSDKTNELIFVGDIVAISCYSYEEPEQDAFGEILELEFGYGILDEETGEPIYLSDFRGSYRTIYAIYGTIHDSPELLKRGESE